ncbi:sap protein [Fusarium flagelliforme]|uniref:Sap protein n=1 Tax=Fusarium flagelliforme TaxID=2675880 RepID=A0A395MCQ3_9HYPO|nr:sap protein [Fusarium flagelliforme]
MAEYATLKVPELKKLLAEKGLPQTGNKADLISRLQENDNKQSEPEAKPAENKEDEISYSDDEAPVAPAAEVPATTSAPATEAPAAEAAPAEPAKAEEAAEEKPEETAEAKAAAESEKYAAGLSSTAADEEAKKRLERAKRFGIEEDDDAKKRADRAKRFGLDEKELATTLDSALPERSRKRGREAKTETEGSRPGKRQSMDRRNGPGGRRRQGRGGRDGGRDGGARKEGAATRSGILNDPTEKAKAEKRAARFAGN